MRIARQISLHVVLMAALSGCNSPWTARICASNNSGNCRGKTERAYEHTIKSDSVGPVEGVTDVDLKDPRCDNGIAAVDVKVVEQDELQVTIHCLADQPTVGPGGDGTMTLSETAAAPAAAPAPEGTVP